MSEHPVTTATTIAASGGPIEMGGHHVGFNSPGVWVAASMLVVIGFMLWKGVPGLIARALDNKIASIRAQLDEAARLRVEAETLRAEYQGRAAAAADEAKAILAHARDEAETMLAKAKRDAETLVARRTRMAEDKIAAAERAAIAEVRARVASVSAAAAARLIAERHDAGADKALIDKTIAELGAR